MNISAVRNYSCNYQSNSLSKTTNPNFKGGLNNTQTKRVLNMLQARLTDVKPANNIQEFKNEIDKLQRKYSAFGINSVGAMIIPKDELAGFIGENACKQHNLKDKMGICIAVGDTYGPVEKWNKTYESVALIMPESCFR